MDYTSKMLSFFSKNKFVTYITTIIFIFFTIWWIYLNFIISDADANSREIFSAFYGLLALWGGFIGLLVSKEWGGYKSLMGKSLLFFALGLLLQEFGQISYSIYSLYLHQEVPYPSIGDVGFFGSIPAYILGALYLSRVSGTYFTVSSRKNKLVAVSVPLLLLLVSYMFFLNGYAFDQSSALTTFLDFGYPLAQSFYISVALLTYLLSKNILGGIMKNKVLLVLFALLVQYIADFSFLYTDSRDIFQTAGFVELIYLIAYFLMIVAIIRISSVAQSLKMGNIEV